MRYIFIPRTHLTPTTSWDPDLMIEGHGERARMFFPETWYWSQDTKVWTSTIKLNHLLTSFHCFHCSVNNMDLNSYFWNANLMWQSIPSTNKTNPLLKSSTNVSSFSLGSVAYYFCNCKNHMLNTYKGEKSWHLSLKCQLPKGKNFMLHSFCTLVPKTVHGM